MNSTNPLVLTLETKSAPKRGGRASLAALGILLVVACLTGCASLPKPRPEWSERRAVDTENTTWAHTLTSATTAHPGMSGIQLLPDGHDALSARLALADTAERCLDMQYYIWKPDDTGRLLADRLLRAADRGVRVRLLLDDIGGSASDAVLQAIDAHTNVEVRVFNPVADRSFRGLSMLFSFQRVTRRMHNKSFTADRLVTILGGRNIEDRYYGFGEEPHFADYDVVAAGPAASDVVAMFDRYWFSSSSIPIHALAKKSISPERVAELRSQLTAQVAEVTNSEEFKILAGNEVGAGILAHKPALVWGPTRLVSDLPEKTTSDPNNTSTHMLPEVRGVAEGTKNEFIVVSPYFVPGTKGVEFFRSLRARGVRVVIVSNSLAANDVAPVHVGYRRYRKALLRAGVEMWEMKPDVQVRGTAQNADSVGKHEGKSPGSSLHAKSFVFDRQALFVGSLNLDPHSVTLNTELGLIIDIPKLAGPAADSLEAKLAQSAYRVEFVPGPGPSKECGSIVWHSQENGREVRYTHEPHASFGRQLQVFLLSFLPIESQL